MTDISNKTLGIIVGLALIVSLIGMFSLPNSRLFSLMGMGTTGEARINITESAALNVTKLIVDFGNGTLTTGRTSCTMTSQDAGAGGGDPDNCFTPSWGADGATDGFHIDNIGNLALNVTVKSTKTNADAFWGVAGGQYKMKCSGNGTVANALATYQNVGTSEVDCIYYLPSPANTDSFRVDVNITIPEGASGFKNDTITFNGIKA